MHIKVDVYEGGFAVIGDGGQMVNVRGSENTISSG